MARGKRTSVTELIAQVESKVAAKEAEIGKLKSELKDLRKKQKKELAQELVKAVEEKGISIEEAIDKIKG